MENIAYPMSPKQVLDISTKIGYFLLSYGAEISRAEDTANRICSAYGIKSHVFAISSSIVVTIETDGETLTQTRRVTSVSINLDRVSKFNALSREICENLPSYDKINSKINSIESGKLYGKKVSVLSYSLIGAAFAVFFGGGFLECLSAAVAAFFARILMLFLERFKVAPFFVTAAASAGISILVFAFSRIFPTLNIQSSQLGALMNLVPGVALTNSIRDFLSSDYTAGTTRLTESFFTAAGVALGLSVSILWH